MGKIAIMFPMIASVWEVKECRRACQRVMDELTAEGIPFNKDTELGIMIETPAAVFMAQSWPSWWTFSPWDQRSHPVHPGLRPAVQRLGQIL